MTDDLASTLTRWRKAEQAATKGPWQVDATQEGDPVIYTPATVPPGSAAVLFEAHWGSEADAEFIAAARNAVPRLLAAIDAVLELADEMEAAPYEDDMTEAAARVTDTARGLGHILRVAITTALTGQETE